jgi:Uma2 family endonuclease
MQIEILEMAAQANAVATEDDLRAAPEDGYKHELVDGKIVMSPAGFRHGLVSVKLATRLETFVESHGLGYVLESSTGFRLPGGNVRLPDVSFVAHREGTDLVTDDFSNVPPDLAVEVLSPSDRSRQVLDKVGEYLDAGVRLVWVIDPKGQSAAIYRSTIKVTEIGIDGVLDGQDVVPGFRCTLREILE